MPAHDESIALAVAIANAADDVKAIDPRLYDVADILGVVDAFVLVSAGSDRQLNAVVDRIEHVLREDHDERPLRREGTAASGWVLLDFGAVVVHAFTTAEREHFDLDRLFSDAAQHDALTGDLVREMVAGADDRSGSQDVHLGLAAAPGAAAADESSPADA